jgi:hypothetical protein
VLHLEHRVKVSFDVDAWLGIVEPPWKRLGAVEIVPDAEGLIKFGLISISILL